MFASSENDLITGGISEADAIVQFLDSQPSLHDLGEILRFIEAEAPEYRVHKVSNPHPRSNKLTSMS